MNNVSTDNKFQKNKLDTKEQLKWQKDVFCHYINNQLPELCRLKSEYNLKNEEIELLYHLIVRESSEQQASFFMEIPLEKLEALFKQINQKLNTDTINDIFLKIGGYLGYNHRKNRDYKCWPPST